MHLLRGLWAQILIWIILPLILILVLVSFGSITLHQRSMRLMVAGRDAELAGLASARLNDELEARAATLRTLLGQEQAAQNVQPPPQSTALLRRQFDLGLVLSNQGSVAELVPVASAVDSVERILLAAADDPGQVVVRPLIEAEPPWPVLMALAEQDTGRAAAGLISADGLELPGLLQQLGMEPRSVAYIVDETGQVVYHPVTEIVGTERAGHEAVLEAAQMEVGFAFIELPGEDEHVVAYAPIPISRWRLIVEEPWIDVVAPVLRLTLLAPLLVLAAAVVSLVALHFGLQRVIRPLQVLGRQASRLAWGDFQAIRKPVQAIEEVQDLQRTLQDVAAQIHRSQAGMQDYIAALTRTQEEERKRIARELHDETVQSLVALSQRVRMLELDWGEWAGDHRPTPPMLRAQSRLSEVTRMLNQALQEVRNIIRDLRPVYLEELGLVPALEALMETAAKSGVESDLQLAGETQRLPGEAELAIYRVAQEAVQNALRHSGASAIGMRLEGTGDGVTLSVEDNGRGFTVPETPGDLAREGHFGLVGMHERITRLGGHLSIRSTPDGGTRVVAFLPVAEPQLAT